jgi:hypothetical protein
MSDAKAAYAVWQYTMTMLTASVAAEFKPGGESVILGPDGNCWHNARTLCRQRPELDYVEGVVLLANGETSTHAWAASGSEVVEATAGFEDVLRYRGIVLDLADVTEWEQAHEYGTRRGYLLDLTFQGLS